MTQQFYSYGFSQEKENRCPKIIKMFIAALLIIPSLLITPFRGGSKKEQRIKNDSYTLI